jgi:ABC-type nickel/cobalt efflux system permease component RcnA
MNLPLVAICLFLVVSATQAHPLGNFSVNQYARLEVGGERLRVRYVVDMAEIPTLQVLQQLGANANGAISNTALRLYLEKAAVEYAAGLRLTLEGVHVPLELVSKNIEQRPGAGGLTTMRIECDLAAALPAGGSTRRLRFENNNHADRIGWREVFVTPTPGVSVFDSSAFGNGVTDELNAYPEDRLAAPLEERAAEFSFTLGALPVGARPLITRDGRSAAAARDRFTELIAVPDLTTGVALLGLLVASALGGLHAFSPGHGKTVVGAYLVGSRGTAKHAAFLGLTVTATHTSSVFALGLVTLFASQYVLPEKLFPALSLASGVIILALGLSLFVTRLRSALGNPQHTHQDHHDAHVDSHDLGHSHSHEPDHLHQQEHEHALPNHHDGLVHSHGGREHSHLPPGSDGSPVTWRNLLALGVSGGLLPCPSALVVLLSAIYLHRVGYGLLLIVAFSLGLASVLTGIGLAFVFAGRWLQRTTGERRVAASLVRVVPVLSAFVIACVGALLCYEALAQVGIRADALLSDSPGPYSTASVLAFGLVLGLKHAVEADHLAAVTTIVSERRSILGASLVGGLWGVGHTLSLLVAGIAVILFHLRISEQMALALEFCVGLMLVALGANALRKVMRGGTLHLHWHRHGNHIHAHPHVHDGLDERDVLHTHHGLRLSARPFLIGMVHGLAGSAALMLLVLSTISSPLAGLLYVLVFGIGSVGGMILMSALVGLPLRLTATRFARAHFVVRCLAGLFSLSFGLFMVYQIGFKEGLLH